jgi:uncharacterized alkaline shock family protein YloU
MTSTATEKDQTTSTTSERGMQKSASSALTTSQGKTSIASSVVAKIAGMAAREVNGVYKMGGGAARAMGSLRERFPGSSGPSVTSGVAVEVGETQAAIDLDVVVEYGVSIGDLSQGIRRNVIDAVERMTGLQVTEVNIAVDDVHLPDEQDDTPDEEPAQPRVR